MWRERTRSAGPSRDSSVGGLAARLALPVVIVTWGLGPPATKLIGGAPMAAVIVRFGLSSIALATLACATRRRPWRIRNRWVIPAGLAFGLNNAVFFFAVQHASIAVVSVIFALQPAVVLLAAGPILGEHPTTWHLLWTVVAICGTGLVVVGADARVSTDGVGILLASLAMVALSAYHVITKLAGSRDPIDPLEWMTAVTAVAWLGLTPVALATTRVDDYTALDGIDLALIAFVALVVGVLGHTLMSWVHRGMPANRSAVYLMLFNVVAVVAGWLVNEQPLSPTQLLGMTVVLVSVGAITARGAARAVPGREVSGTSNRNEQDELECL